MKKLLIVTSLLISQFGFAMGKDPLKTGIRCTTTVLKNDGTEAPATIDLFAISPTRQLTSLIVHHGDVTLTLIADSKPVSFPKYVVANQINNIKQVKTLIVDPTVADKDGKKSENINVKFKLKVKYDLDAKTGKVGYSGSILYSFPDGHGDTLDASGVVQCSCIDNSGGAVECAKNE